MKNFRKKNEEEKKREKKKKKKKREKKEREKKKKKKKKTTNLQGERHGKISITFLPMCTFGLFNHLSAIGIG